MEMILFWLSLPKSSFELWYESDLVCGGHLLMAK